MDLEKSRAPGTRAPSRLFVCKLLRIDDERHLAVFRFIDDFFPMSAAVLRMCIMHIYFVLEVR